MTIRNAYLRVISSATGITDMQKLIKIEDALRSDYFQSELDWVTLKELATGAKVCAKSLGFLE